jgi:hypothetical protein
MRGKNLGWDVTLKILFIQKSSCTNTCNRSIEAIILIILGVPYLSVVFIHCPVFLDDAIKIIESSSCSLKDGNVSR